MLKKKLKQNSSIYYFHTQLCEIILFIIFYPLFYIFCGCFYLIILATIHNLNSLDKFCLFFFLQCRVQTNFMGINQIETIEMNKKKAYLRTRRRVDSNHCSFFHSRFSAAITKKIKQNE